MKQRFLYLYDYGNQHESDVQFIAASAETPRGRYPQIVERHGKMPSQYQGWNEGDEDFDEDEREDENDDEKA